eukprot:scaffold60_cov382-Prasinococcus_capsulatus_cf.AAC.6
MCPHALVDLRCARAAGSSRGCASGYNRAPEPTPGHQKSYIGCAAECLVRQALVAAPPGLSDQRTSRTPCFAVAPLRSSSKCRIRKSWTMLLPRRIRT